MGYRPFDSLSVSARNRAKRVLRSAPAAERAALWRSPSSTIATASAFPRRFRHCSSANCSSMKSLEARREIGDLHGLRFGFDTNTDGHGVFPLVGIRYNSTLTAGAFQGLGRCLSVANEKAADSERAISPCP